MDTLVDLLLRFYASEATSVGFPELLCPAAVLIRKFLKTAKNGKICKQLRQVLDRLEDNEKFITTKRAQLDAAPRDTAKIVSENVVLEILLLMRSSISQAAFEEGLTSPLTKYYEAYRDMRSKKKTLMRKVCSNFCICKGLTST